jgi:hypothetical protein
LTKQKLSMKQVKSTVDKYEETTVLEFPRVDDAGLPSLDKNGKQYVDTVTVNPYFRPTLINQTVVRHMDNIVSYQEMEIDIEDEDFFPLLHLEIIRTFTDLTFPTNLKDTIPFYKVLVDSVYFQEIMEAFVASEVQKVHQKIIDTVGKSQLLDKELVKFKDKIQNEKFQSLAVQNKVKRIPEA